MSAPRAAGKAAGVRFAQSPHPEVRLAAQVAHVFDTYRTAPLLGMLLPGLGDLLCGLVGLGVVGLAAARHVPRVTLARMCLNLALMVGIGTVPLVGDAFVFWYRGNERNARLLARAEEGGRRPWRDAVVLVLAGCALLLALALPVVALVLGIRWFRVRA